MNDLLLISVASVLTLETDYMILVAELVITILKHCLRSSYIESEIQCR